MCGVIAMKWIFLGCVIWDAVDYLIHSWRRDALNRHADWNEMLLFLILWKLFSD